MNVTYDFGGKVALVTGAGSGIGRASAAAFGTAGASVAVGDISEENGRTAVDAIVAAGGTAEFFPVDVSDEASVVALVEAVVSRFGGLDVAHNNAGVEADPVAMGDLAGESWRRVVDINLSGVFYCMKAEIAAMSTRGGGAIVNTASASGLIGGYKHSDYTAAKHGVIGLTKAAALDYATAGIRINAVCPGLIDTPFVAYLPEAAMERLMFGTPMSRMGRPDEVAASVLWLCSDAASYVTGHALSVDGGVTIGGIGTRFDGIDF